MVVPYSETVLELADIPKAVGSPAQTYAYWNHVHPNMLNTTGGTLTGPLTLAGAPTLDLHAATKKYVDDGLTLKLPLTGGTLTGSLNLSGGTSSLTVGGTVQVNKNLTVGTTDAQGSRSLRLISTAAGGENNFDSTSRIELESYQRWQKHNQAGDPDEAHYGELVRLNLRKDNAKAVIAWRDKYTDPDNPTTLAAIVGHYLPNDPQAEVHGHLSIEVPDSEGLIQTRFEVRFVDEDGNVGVDQALIKTSDARFVVGADNGALHVAASAGTAKNMYFNNNSHGLSAGRRWGIQADSTAENGSNSGTDFRINRLNDAGDFQGTALFIKRDTGVVGIGGLTATSTPAVSAKLDVLEAGARHTIRAEQSTASAVNYATFGAVLGNTANRAVDVRGAADSSARFVLYGTGRMELGGGGPDGRDTNLYREAANILTTDDRLVVNSTYSTTAYAALPKGVANRSNNAGIVIGSSYSGGDDDGIGTDSTGRLNLYAYQRANAGSFGESIRHFLMRSDAKTMQAFYMPVASTGTKYAGYDPATRDPKATGVSWKPVVWQGAHYEANSHGTIHAHWELEVADENGQLQGRLEIPFIDQSKGGGYGASNGQLDGAVIGIAYTNIRTNLADLSVRAQAITAGDYTGQGYTCFRIGGNNSVEKNIVFANSSDMGTTARRWVIRANNTTESGSNVGTDWQVLRYADDGTVLGTAIGVERATGNLSFGAAPGGRSARIAAVWGTPGTHGVSVQPSSSPGAAAGFDAQMTATTDRAYQSAVAGDASRRWVVYADGKQEWGDGTTRDVNLHRVAAGRLKTDGNFTVQGALSVGTTPSGSDMVTILQSTDTNAMSLTNNVAGGNTQAPLLRLESATATSLMLTTRATGDAASRWLVTATGAMQWGDGTNAKDVNLFRDAADRLRTNDSFRADINLLLNTTSVGGGVGVLGIADAATVPTANPTAGGVVYVNAGALFFRGSNGTVTQLAAA
ncbi:hypothetical protein AB0B66_18835 [Catellatospora sp. NPDC049111]|uniref:hypothetical protein n=1 Tax=Catellatospora sp. NPDC049111 TaxID=3155271 RepID=UPI0033FD9F0D